MIFGYSAGWENFPAAVEAARKADVAILCMGDNEETSGENFDRTDLNLPGRQLELVQAVYATGTPVVLVLQSGRPVTANWENDHLPAILEAWFPGEQGGTAIAKHCLAMQPRVDGFPSHSRAVSGRFPAITAGDPAAENAMWRWTGCRCIRLATV